VPIGLLEPNSCNNIKCIIDNANIKKGKKKCKLKNLFNVASSTEKPPHSHRTISGPTSGIAENKLIITVAAQKLICPHGNTYPKNEVAIINKKITTPVVHNKWRG
jgi:hypothetical protein